MNHIGNWIWLATVAATYRAEMRTHPSGELPRTSTARN